MTITQALAAAEVSAMLSPSLVPYTQAVPALRVLAAEVRRLRERQEAIAFRLRNHLEYLDPGPDPEAKHTDVIREAIRMLNDTLNLDHPPGVQQ